ncbi:uncharacterized protein LOC123306997 [Coccinella septempunctata]|uniref:uncharacterized protein LOC123306997 n=1 Tax=Coccinella septempunctata TaxID=41139 RepID=UPI001D06B626|nr:uncharacterized protein LOC123306997 [Coccinella septempunctata]
MFEQHDLEEQIIRPIMTHTAESKPDTSRTRQLLETTEMRVLRRITGKTLRDRERSENIRRECKTENINEWVRGRKVEWNRHIGRMTEDRLVRIARDKSPSGRRSVGRPRKRWSDASTWDEVNSFDGRTGLRPNL